MAFDLGRFVLNFAGSPVPELCETLFSHPLLGETRRCVRGRQAGAYRGYCSFPWSKGVQALSLLILEALVTADNDPRQLIMPPLLVGSAQSLAACLDYAIDKRTNWLAEIFGCDGRGELLAKRIILRSNPSRKRPGPVGLSLNQHFLPVSALEIWHNCRCVTDLERLKEMRDAIRNAVDLADPAVAKVA